MLRKKLTLKPIIVVEILLVMLVAGIGSAYALTATALPATEMNPSHADIANATDLAVDTTPGPGYKLNFDLDMANIVSVDVDVENTDSGNHDGTVDVSLLDSSGSVLASGSLSQTFTPGNTTVTVDTTDVAPDNVVKLHIIITQTS